MLPKKSADDFPETIKHLIVEKLVDSSFMGIYFPCRKMPQL